MKKFMISGIAILCLINSTNNPAKAVEDSHSEFFNNDRSYWSRGLKVPEKPDYSWAGSLVSSSPITNARSPRTRADRVHVEQRVKERVRAELGDQWVPTAVSLARLESGFNCRATGPHTRHGRAKGVFQVMPGSARALGYDYAKLHDCDYGIAAGIAHMRSCIRAGVRTHSDMARCHVAGVGGWNARLNRSAERYKNKYVRLASRM
jgi:hypothetical protein